MARTSGEIAAVVWHGTPAEASELLSAIARNCTCETQDEIRTSTCPSHEMIVRDQRVLDGLVFVRRIAPLLEAEEWEPLDVDGLTTALEF